MITGKMIRILWMVVKSDKPPIGWLKPEKMGCVYHRFQLEKDFANILYT